MEKGLSQAQRDQILMNTAKEEVMMKKQMLDAFEKSNNTLDESLSRMTNCLNSLGEGISSGMKMIAMALAGAPPQPNPTQFVSAPTYQPNYFCNTTSQSANAASFNFIDRGLINSCMTAHPQIMLIN